MSLRKLSGAAAAGSRDSYAAGNAGGSLSTGNGSTMTGNGSSGGGGGGGAATGNTSASKAYSTHLAVQSDAAKYRGKYKELKKKVRQIEGENDRLHLKTLRIKRNIQRMRLERAILYERLEAELSFNGGLQESADGRQNVQATSERPEEPLQRTPESRGGGGGGGTTSSARRNLDYSPSPEDERPSRSSMTAQHATTSAAPAASTIAKTEQPARASMKITLKRHSNAASHQHNGGKDV